MIGTPILKAYEKLQKTLRQVVKGSSINHVDKNFEFSNPPSPLVDFRRLFPTPPP